jgi:signal peptidase II
LRMRIWGPSSLAGLAVAAGTTLADQIHKAWMIGVFDAAQTRKITVTPFFDLVLIWNQGISYGLFKQDGEWGRFALIAFSLAAVLALFYWLAQVQTRLSAVGIGFVIGGALGNVIDRLHYGAVADFFAFHVAGFHWYVFNLADVAIVAGVAGLLFDSLRSSHKSAGNQI